MRAVGITLAGEEQVAGAQGDDVFLAILAIVHVDLAIHHRKHFFAIVDVPSIRLVGPVQAHGRIGYGGNQFGAPGAGGDKFSATDNFHAGILARLHPALVPSMME